METIDQQVINDNKAIYARIQRELLQASSEILIATAWFTDEDLFNTLSIKLEEGVHVEIIIADNQENEKLAFEKLVAKGAIVYKVKSTGYGTMNQKFAVIDRRIALHGSYNWTVNAKKNNHESIISTDHKETINSLLENFINIRNRIQEQNGEPVLKNETSIIHPEHPKGIPVENFLKAGEAFENILDSMISAEVRNFDRKLLRDYGFERCKSTSGDHQVLHKAFDSLYFLFIKDIDVVDDKKRRLIARIEEHRVKSQNTLGKEFELQIAHLEKEYALSINALQTNKTKLETEIEVTTKSIDDIRENKVPFLQGQNAALEKQIKEKEIEFIRPKFKWFEFIPALLFSLALLVYLFIFYSSAAYILLFSVEDGKLLLEQNIQLPPAQIFNPDALSKASEKNWNAVLFMFLFVVIPLTITVVNRFVAARWNTFATITGFVFGVIFLDGAIAYKVSEAIYKTDYLQGTTNIPWKPGMAFTDTNFYLVFVFGAFGLLLFKFAIGKLLNIFEDRSPDTITQRNRIHIKQLRDEINTNIEKINALKDQVIAHEKNVLQLKADIKSAEISLSELPKTFNQTVQKKKSQFLKDSETIDNITGIYTMRIQSDNLPISIDALKDRINIFLEGWNDSLFKEFAVEKATLKTPQAAEVAASWEADKISVRKIDKRVKVNHDE